MGRLSLSIPTLSLNRVKIGPGGSRTLDRRGIIVITHHQGMLYLKARCSTTELQVRHVVW